MITTNLTYYNELKQIVEQYLPSCLHEKKSQYGQLAQNAQLNALFDIAPSIVIVLNIQEVKYEYFSRNVKNILGYDSETYMLQGLGFAMSTMDPEHVHIHNHYMYVEILKHTQKYLATHEVKNLRFTTTFKVKKANGEYIWAMQQFSIIELDRDGLPLLSLLFMHDISEVKKHSQPDLVIALKNQHGCYAPIYAASYPSPDKQTIFSKRELEILQLLSLGLSSKKIADKLFLSEHTVKRHRKNMLKKTDSSNTTELFRFATVNHLLTMG